MANNTPEELLNHVTEYMNSKKKPMIPLTLTEQRKYDNVTDCWICMEPLNGPSVMDHCHITGA